MTPSQLSAWLAAGPRILDGAMGSELLRLGGQAADTLWGAGTLIDAPEMIREVHRLNAAAGAEALTTATFRIAPYSLRRIGMESRAAELAARAVRLAREGAAAAERDALVLASQTTLEDCYRPDLVPDAATLEREHHATADALAAAAPDALLLETFNTIAEARIAATAAVQTRLAVIVSFTCIGSGRLLSEEDAREAAAAVSIPGVVAIGVNCTRVPEMLPALERIADASRLPLVAYANNAWFAEDSPWLEAEEVDPGRYGTSVIPWIEAGARLVGGCCGTTPDHIAAVARTVGRRDRR